MGSFSLIHWIILGLIILLLFGGNRFSAMMKDVAQGLKSFKQGLAEDDKPVERPDDPRRLPPHSRSPERPIDVTAEPREPVAREVPPPPSDEQPRG